ncbi:MAG: hypothetical protein JSW35_05895 [Deltaproteobacteria bacterium]|nr:MAG: hypothetical protein JSW35_05895 [Deltaproteobacteria bacterium]
MKGNRGLLLLVIALIAGGLLVLYFSGKEGEKQPVFQEEEKREAEDTSVSSPDIQAPQERLEDVLGEKAIEGQAMRVEDECQKMKRELMEFFAYLDKEPYVRELEIGEDTFTRFKKIVHVLSLNPPLPAGEGINYDRIIENIYHFYRVLTLKDLRLIKLIARNEADSMEITLALFYRWLMSGDQCNRDNGLPPSWDAIYRYAGFLVNSIGGRSYLFRRDTRLRLLLSYYCLLIIHEADKRKMNSFGIDITPFLEPLAEEIEHYQLLYFRKEYAGKLIDIKSYYLRKRKAS